VVSFWLESFSRCSKGKKERILLSWLKANKPRVPLTLQQVIGPDEVVSNSVLDHEVSEPLDVAGGPLN